MSSKKNRQAAARAVLAAATPAQLKDAGISVKPLESAVQVDVGLVPATSLATEAQVDAATGEAQTAGAPAPAAKPSKARRPAGLGHPEAKKLINPQHTLEMKKAAAQKLGGTMVYQNRNWIIHVPKGEFKIPSRTLAGFSLASFIQEISKEPKAVVVDPTPQVSTGAGEAEVEEMAEDTAV